jgi:hypothetical protein
MKLDPTLPDPESTIFSVPQFFSATGVAPARSIRCVIAHARDVCSPRPSWHRARAALATSGQTKRENCHARDHPKRIAGARQQVAPDTRMFPQIIFFRLMYINTLLK